jgi:catechol 2,3-dioxygenase-like lactoylglutathione lyase family enzyme
MALPVPVIDHVVINVRDRLDEAAALYERLGFQLTPRGHHTLGSSNHLAVLGTDYIELLGVMPGAAGRSDVTDWPAGLNGLAFKTGDSDGLYDTLSEAGAPVLPPQAFSRPVDLGDGRSRDAAFRTVRLEQDASPAGRLFFCHHLTPDLVWHDPWRRHPNGAVGLAGIVIAAADPGAYAALFALLFDEASLRTTAHGAVLSAGLATVEVTTPEAAAMRFGDAAPALQDRPAVMAALMVRTASLRLTRAALEAGGVPVPPGGGPVVVGADQAGGLALIFVE